MIQQTSDAKPRGQHPTVFDAAACAPRSAMPSSSSPRHIVKSPVMAWCSPAPCCPRCSPPRGAAPAGFGWSVTAILLVTVLFGNFAEAVAEARGRGQAASLRRARKDLVARKRV
jgi:K+-transporting ATPase ATPase B chain